MTDERVIRAALHRVARRMRRGAALRGAATGLPAGLVLGLLAWFTGAASPGTLLAGLAATGMLIGALTGFIRTPVRPGAAARIIERGTPESRNVIFTAAELAESAGGLEGAELAEGDDGSGGDSEPTEIRNTILARAALLLEGVDAGRLIPLRRPAAALAGGGVALALLLIIATRPPTALPAVLGDILPGPPRTTASIEFVLTPPAWTGGAPTTMRDPDELVLLAGTRIQVTVRGHAARVTLETIDGRTPMASTEANLFTGTLAPRSDGFLAIEGRDDGPDDGVSVFRRLIGVTVHPHGSPRVRIVEPARDLYFPDGNRTIEVTIEADDDHALAGLELHYTRVSGFGELFDFRQGTVPLELTRHAAGRWTGVAAWDLSGLELDRGESVVYHARAVNRSPEAPPGESDTWMVEVLGGEAAPSGGFAGDDETTRYALSQQMILVLTERLLAGRDTLSADDFLHESMTLAAAQRRVRAEFVFMLGGMLESDADHEHTDDDHDHDDDVPVDPFADPDPDAMDLHEEAHARADADAAEGRLAQQGRVELIRSIQAMSHAAALLLEGRAEEAFPVEETALFHLQRAFSSSRYILRALPEREQLDFDRRLSGSRADATADRRSVPHSELPPEVLELRSLLSRSATIAARGLANVEPSGLLELAGSVLALDPTSPELRGASASISDAADARAGGEIEDAERLLHAGIEALAIEARAHLAPAPGPVPTGTARRLAGALVDALAR